jgi:hypothetical protein
MLSEAEKYKAEDEEAAVSYFTIVPRVALADQSRAECRPRTALRAMHSH